MQNCRKYPFVQNHRFAKTKNMKLNESYIWDTLEIDWKEVSVTFNDIKINLPTVVTIKLKDKVKIRCLMNKEPLLFHIMLKQGITWFTLALGTQETVWNNTTETVNDNIDNFQMTCILKSECNFLHGYFRYLLPIETMDVEIKIKTMKVIHTFKRDQTTQVISCNPWSTRLHPYPSLIRKMNT